MLTFPTATALLTTNANLGELVVYSVESNLRRYALRLRRRLTVYGLSLRRTFEERCDRGIKGESPRFFPGLVGYLHGCAKVEQQRNQRSKPAPCGDVQRGVVVFVPSPDLRSLPASPATKGWCSW